MNIVLYAFFISQNDFRIKQNKQTKSQNKTRKDFPGGAVVKNPPANTGDMGSIPGPGKSHMPQNN